MSTPFPPPPPPSAGGFMPPPPPSTGATPPPGFAPFGPGATATAYADFGSRLVAWLLDHLLSLLYVLPGAALVVIGALQQVDEVNTFAMNTPRVSWFGFALILAGVAVALAGVVLYYVQYSRRIGSTGQSWGMKKAGIRLVSLVGPMTAGKAFGRVFVAWIISGSVCYLGYLWMLWDPKKQTWHDKIFDTVSVRA